MPSIVVIVNSGGGSFVASETEQALRDAFSRHSIEPEIKIAKDGSQIEQFAREAIKGDTEIIVAGGGDGTVSSVASIVSQSDKKFGVLPLGTLNNFSKDLGIPQDIDEAANVIAKGHTAKIDLAEVNGRIFINNSSIGLYPQIVRKREKQQRLGYGKWRAAFWAALRSVRVSPFLKVRIELGGKSFLRKTPFVFVGNNQYEMDLYNIGRRPTLADGKLSVYFLRRGGRWGVVFLLLRTLTGTVRQWRDFEEILTDAVTIQTKRRRMNVAFDGEVYIVETPLNYKTLPGALTVVIPEPEAKENA